LIFKDIQKIPVLGGGSFNWNKEKNFVYLRCLISIIYILLFSFPVLFVLKASSIKYFFLIEKKLYCIDRKLYNKDGFKKLDDNRFDKADFPAQEIRQRCILVHWLLWFALINPSLTRSVSFAQASLLFESFKAFLPCFRTVNKI
jgi:hypothetical protein